MELIDDPDTAVSGGKDKRSIDLGGIEVSGIAVTVNYEL
jgi:hypothetical protein